MRLTSLKPLFLKVQRTVRDLAIKLNKPVEFEMAGEDIEIDRTMIELLNDPLIHIVRNALDHGIEKVETRRERRKTEKGTISMVARQAGGRIIVEIQDDGGGINRDKVFAKAVKMGIITGNERLTDEEVFDLIFAPGFSTADQVTDVSGRGVGLDVVKANIKKLKGTIEIESKQGEGSLFKISLPLTTAITEGIVVFIKGIRFVIPMDGIRELLRITDKDITTIKDGHECLSVRGKILPMVRLQSVMYRHALSNSAYSVKDAMASAEEMRDSRNEETVVVVDHLGTLVALTIDGVIGQNQVVVKPLGQHINTTNGIAGAAIMGDGKIALVLDIDGLVRNLKKGSSEKKQEKKAEKKPAESDKRAVA
jgi:two-component system chemotaxis sensor kinase CheA